VPGRIDSAKSEGCHQLIRAGATLVHSVADILAELRYPGTPAAPRAAATAAINHGLSPEEQCIVSSLEIYPKDIDTIITETQLPARQVNALLLGLELKGLVSALPGQQYQMASGR